MSKGVIECTSVIRGTSVSRGFWEKTAHEGFEDLFERILKYPHSYEGWMYRYREGKRAVMLWPEERMGEVVDCG